MINLRDYQKNMINDIGYEYENGKQSVCLVGPCGCGKTVMVGWMTAAAALKGSKVLFLVHRQELIDQSSATFAAMNINHGIIAAKYPQQYDKAVQIGSVQTVVKRLDKISPPDFIIVDECHHVIANTYKRIIAEFPKALVLGVTATPERMGGQGLGDVFSSMVIGPEVKELIGWGNLAPYDLYAPPLKFDAGAMRVRFGDFVKQDLENTMDDSALIGDVIETYQKLADGMRAICYCVSVAHSEHMAECFRLAGIAAEHIDGETDKNVRNRVINDFRDGKIKVICNVDLISEGFDVPAMEAVILARPTQSLTLYIQQAMRAMRPDKNNPGKRAVIIDHAGNVFRHGLPDEEREWSLESKAKKKRKSNREIAVRACPNCYQVHEPAPVCPFCGFEYPKNQRERMPEQKDGELLKVEELERKQRRQEVGRARTIKELEHIAISRGYSMRWVTHIAKAKHIYG